MKRNLFAIFLAMALVVALVFVVAPSAKADPMTVVQATSNCLPEGFDFNNNILDLNGHDVVVETDETISVINTAFMHKESGELVLDLTGNHAGSLTIIGEGKPETVSFDGNFRYLAVKDGNTYTFHPFNLAISRLGLNTVGKDKNNPAISIEAVFIANDVVKAKLNEDGNDYGLKNPDVTALNGDSANVGSAKQNEKYRFGNSNGVAARYDLENSLTTNIDNVYNVQAYMVIDGEEITNKAIEVTPREVLKNINKDTSITPTDAQMERIEALFVKEDYARFKNILTNFRAEAGNASLSFADKAQRTEYSTTKQVWEQNGITLTNNKASSTNNVADYSNPVRIYKGSQVIIEATGMTKIVLNCNDGEYATTGLTTTSDYTVTKSGNVTTVEFTTPVDIFTFNASSGQLRFDSITVSATFAPACDHLKNATEATCTKGAVCIDCEKEHGDLLDHVEKTAATCTSKAICLNCGNSYGNMLAHDHIADATCTTPAQCSICGSYGSVNANNHKDGNTDHICDLGCGKDNLGTHIDADGDTVCDYGCNVKIEAGEVTLIDKTYTYSFSSKQYSANGTKTLGSVNWTLAGNGGFWGYDNQNGKGQQFGSGSAPFKSLTFTSAEFKNVSKITINTSGASSVNASFTVWVGGVQVGSSKKLTKTATTYTFEVPEGTLLTGAVEFRYTQTSSKAIYIKSISVDYAEPA